MLKRAIMVIIAFAVMVSMTGCYSTPEGGEVIVVRNGGPLDDKQIRQVVPNGAGNTWSGVFSESHPYPASDQQRIYKFDDAEGSDAPPVRVPTRDGVLVSLTGTFFFNTVFDGSKEGRALVQQFDTRYGTRAFNGRKPWEDGGFSRFLNVVVQPIIDSNLREVIAEFDCKQLVSSCALVQRGGEQIDEKAVKEANNKSNVTRVQDRINEGLVTGLRSKLDETFFANIRFSLGTVQPNEEVQQAINQAQSAFAEVSKAQARVEQAKADAQANEERQKGYNTCAACQRIDEIKALPRGLTALGGDFAVGIK